MKEEAYAEIICRGYCKFYKKDKEEMHCGGYEMLREHLTVNELKLLANYISEMPASVDDEFINFICNKCAFESDGCDFREGLDSPPCGGYLIISRLKFFCPLSNP